MDETNTGVDRDENAFLHARVQVSCSRSSKDGCKNTLPYGSSFKMCEPCRMKARRAEARRRQRREEAVRSQPYAIEFLVKFVFARLSHCFCCTRFSSQYLVSLFLLYAIEYAVSSLTVFILALPPLHPLATVLDRVCSFLHAEVTWLPKQVAI